MNWHLIKYARPRNAVGHALVYGASEAAALERLAKWDNSYCWPLETRVADGDMGNGLVVPADTVVLSVPVVTLNWYMGVVQ